MIGRGGEQLHSFLAFLLLAAGEGFGGGVDPQTGGAIAWDGKGAAQVGEGEEGGPVGGAEPGDPSLAGEAVLPMKLRVEVGDLFIGLCAALLIVFGACLWPPKVVPKEADIGGSCWYCWRRHIHSVERWHCGQKDKKCETTFRMRQAMMVWLCEPFASKA